MGIYLPRKKKLKTRSKLYYFNQYHFWPLFCVVGAVKLLGYPTWLFDIVRCLSAWSSTFAFALLFQESILSNVLYTLSNKIQNKLSFSVIVLIVMIQTAIFIMILFHIKNNYEETSILRCPHGAC